MPKFVIERGIPAIGASSTDELRAITQKSNAVLDELDHRVQWVTSYVTDDKMYCVYIADDPELVREHARKGGFPADSVLAVSAVIDPTTARA